MAKVCKFQIERQYVSYDCGETWQPTDMKRKKDQEAVERYSTDCGWSDSFFYRWVDDDDTMCVGYHKYSTKKQQVSYDLGDSWEDVPDSTTINRIVERFSPDCCQLRTVSGVTCDEIYRKVNASIQEASLDGEVWIQTGCYTIDSVIESYSPECLMNAEVKYYGIPVDDDTQKQSFFNYNYYVTGTGVTNLEARYGDTGYAIVGCDRNQPLYRSDGYEAYGETYRVENGNIEELYIFDCAESPNPNITDSTRNTLRKLHISSGVTGALGVTGNYNSNPQFQGNANFSGCTSLEEIDGLGECGIDWIGGRIFEGCTSLSSVTLPESLEVLGKNAFASCSGLASVTVKSKVLKGKTLTPPAGNSSNRPIEVDADHQFSGCESLTGVTFPDNYYGIIYPYMFEGCTSLSSVTLGRPSSIGNYSFYGNTSLTTIDLGRRVSYIGSNAFAGCTSLTDVHLPGNGFPDIYTTSFPSGVTIHCTCNTYDNWMRYKSESHLDINVVVDSSTTRWVEDANTICDGYDEYKAEKEQTSCDGTNWYDTGNRRKTSELVKQNSTDCGYQPPEQDIMIKVEYDDGTVLT